ncbi:hypothetical protein ABTN73_20640, partial [Acinetobacter baumannii]
GAQIIDARHGLAVDIAGPLASAYASIAGADHDPSVRWVRSIDGGDPEEDESASEVAAASDTATAFRQALTARRSIEL